MKSIFTCLVVAGVLLISGCTAPQGKPEDIASLKIDDAYFLGANTSDDECPNNLVKIAVNDITSEISTVDFLDSDGNFLDSDQADIEVMDIIMLTEKYALLWGAFTFQLKEGERFSMALVFDLETGALYDLGLYFQPMVENWYLGEKYHQTDNEGNIYFTSGAVNRLVAAEEGKLYLENYMNYWEGYDLTFFVDGFGNVFFNEGTRVKLADGGIVDAGEEMMYFQASDGTAIGFTLRNQYNFDFYYINIDGSEISKDYIGKLPKNALNTFFLKHHLCRENHKHFLADNYYDQNKPVAGFVLDESTNTLFKLQISTLSQERNSILGFEDDYLWVKDDQDRLYAFDVKESVVDNLYGTVVLEEYTMFEFPADFEVQSMLFNKNHVIEFRAYNFSTEMWIKGFVTMKNGLEYLDEDTANGKVELVRIR